MPESNAGRTFRDVAFSFRGRKALVVGGSRGIGKGLVDALVASGADVAYVARGSMDADTPARHIAADVRDGKQILALFDDLDTRGGIDILINVAAINHRHLIEEITADEWNDVLAVNLDAVFLLCREAAKRMKPRKSGRIVNVSSIAGRHRSPVSGVHYVASKAGIIGLTRQLAFELAAHGVNVNAVCPSQTVTPMLLETMSKAEREALARSIPMQRIATVEEQVGPILFLCSDAASYITGAVVDVNGGQV